MDGDSETADAFNGKRRTIFFLKADLEQSDSTLRLVAASLDQSTPAIDGHELTRMCGDVLSYRLSPHGVRSLVAKGTFHRLFLATATDGSVIVLRTPVFDDWFFECIMRVEARVMAVVRSRGIPAPATELLEITGQHRRYTVHAAPFIEGIPLAALDDNEAAIGTLLGSIAALLRRLHGIEGSGFGPISLAHPGDRRFIVERSEDVLAGVHQRWNDYVQTRLDEHIGQCAHFGAISSVEVERISMLFHEARDELVNVTQHSVLHGDPGNSNFLVMGNQASAILDWEDSLIGDPMFDIACLATFHPERRFPAIFTGYGLVPTPQSGDLRLFWLYFLRIALAKTVHRHRFGYVDRPGRFPSDKRIQLALERLAA